MEQNRNKYIAGAIRKVRMRPCLACGGGFAAEGPFLRVCSTCKESEEWMSGDGDFAFHAPDQDRRAANDN